MAHHPRVSVIIPTYQCDRYVGQALQSVVMQSDCSFEVIIIDDGSTDNTKAVIAECLQDIPRTLQNRIQYIHQTNQGVCAARNTGIHHATGEFLVFLDADDYFLPNKLSQQVACFDQVPDLGIVHTGWQTLDVEGSIVKLIQPWKQSPTLDLASWLRYKPVLPSAMMFRRSWIQKVGGFNPAYQVAEDVDLVLRLSLAGCVSDWLKEETVVYRQHQSNTMKNGAAQLRDVPRVLAQFFSQSNLPMSIQLIQPEILFNTWVWLSCYLYRNNSAKDALTALKRSIEWTPYSPSATILHWVESYVAYAKEEATPFEPLHLIQLDEWQTLVQDVMSKP